MSNIGPEAPEEKSFEILNIFPIQMHREANLISSYKGQMSMYDHYFSNFGPVPDDLCKDSVTRHPQFWRRRFLKVFTIYGHGGHLGQWTATILTIFHSPTPRRLQMKFEQHWPRGSRGEVICKFSKFFPYKCIGKQTTSLLKRSTVNVRPLF